MKDSVNVKKKKKSNELKQTLDYIFNIDQKEVFNNEVYSLKEEIENSKLNTVKIPTILNYVLYKYNELSFHEKLARNLDKTSRNTLIKEYLEKENFMMTQRHIAEYLKKYNLENFFNKADTINKVKEVISNSENEVDSFLKYESNIVKNQNETGHNNVNDANNILKFYQTNFSDLDRGIKLNSMDTNIRDKNVNFSNTIQIQKKRIVYKLKIFYLDSSENSAQLCNIETDENTDLTTFINQLKKQLGIYEYSKFKIILMDQSNYHKIYLQDISQLKLDEINEIKIVPH